MNNFSRRELLQTAAVTIPAVYFTGLSSALQAKEEYSLAGKHAEHCIMIWLGGGMAHVDTFDPKGAGDPKARKPGCNYPIIDTAVKGVQYSSYLPKLAELADVVTAVRTCNHNVINEHAAATNLVHTGRPTSGNITYPSIGSIVSHVLGPVAEGMPAYMLLGYPNVSRGPGFLGSQAGYLYLTDTTQGPQGFTPPAGLTSEQAKRREELLTLMRQANQDSAVITDYDASVAESIRLSHGDFMKCFEMGSESSSLRNEYGGEFGQRCLLARRLVERGIRFIEVSHNLNFLNGTGWDTHNEGQLNQHLLIKELDDAVAALIKDLKRCNLLDKTLIAICTEFGRPSSFDGRGGRDHQGTTFSMVLAGGGLKHSGAYGVTDELVKNIVENPVSIPDFHATIHKALGINPHAELYDGSRPVPITDHGNPVEALFS